MNKSLLVFFLLLISSTVFATCANPVSFIPQAKPFGDAFCSFSDNISSLTGGALTSPVLIVIFVLVLVIFVLVFLTVFPQMVLGWIFPILLSFLIAIVIIFLLLLSKAYI